MNLRCWVGIHRWVSHGKAVRGVSLYERQRCVRCSVRRTVWNGGELVLKGWE